jgi:Protein of unknown function (DUF3048) C-terminal domain/Protein of unknown function (DUF3048) N-terminal domain
MSGGLTSPKARRAMAGLVIMTGLAMAGCGQGAPDPVGAGGALAQATSSGAAQSPRTVSSSRPLAPLTGLPVASSADAARPAVALDVAGPSPRGLAAADVVFEEATSPVRYIAVYQSREAAGVGPITTTQPTDRAALAVLHPLIGYDGAAAPYFVKLLDSTKIIDVGYAGHSSLYTPAAAGPTTSTRAIARAAPGATAPPPLFSYRDTGVAGGALADRESRRTSVSVTVPGLGSQDWVFNQKADRWLLTGGGPKVQAANLVIQTVQYKQIKVSPRLGVFVPSALVIGAGKAEVFSGSTSGGSGGTAAAGTWSKPRLTDLTNYFGSSGAPMAFLPGPTWIILAPSATHVSTAGP